ncbi:MAG: hypothetical protein QOF74_3085 [Caballeronia mineralivorans]|jgi:hypothetical protein|nr:hypothetical protein [Caballeronia mineralivorans]
MRTTTITGNHDLALSPGRRGLNLAGFIARDAGLATPAEGLPKGHVLYERK